MIFLDIAPAGVSGGVAGTAIAASFFLVLAGAAYIAFRVLKKTVKMAVRMTVVALILVVAVVGSASLWYFASDSAPKSKPPATRRR